MSVVVKDDQNLYRASLTVLKMLRNRGYVINDADLELTEAEYLGSFGHDGRLDRIALSKAYIHGNSEMTIYVRFEDKWTLAKFKESIVRIFEEYPKCDRALIVGIAYEGTFMKKAVQQAEMKGKRIDAFEERELLIDITEHILVPHHIVLSAEEKEQLLKRYKVNETQLPRIQRLDPIARYFGLRKGDIVKIVRNSETAGKYVTYRLCDE